MSGRAKGGAADPKEELRELTRQAHEAARDIRAVLAELRAERLAAEKAVLDMVNDAMRKGQEHIDSEARRVGDLYVQQGQMITDKYADLVGCTDTDGLLDAMVTRLMPDIREAVAATIQKRLPKLTAQVILNEARKEIIDKLDLAGIVSRSS